MQRPRLIASAQVLDRAKGIIALDPVAARERTAFLARVDTIFAMPVFTDPKPRIAVDTATAKAPRLNLPLPPLAAINATPLSFLQRPGAFSVAARLHPGGGRMPEALGLKPKGDQPLDIAKVGLSRMQALGMAWLLTADVKYKVRGVAEMEALAKLTDWGGESSHLAVATFMQALAIGYDWLHAAIGRKTRKRLRRAVIDKGVVPLLAAYRAPLPPNWITTPSNWNVVCNASVIITALAIGPDTNDPRIFEVRTLAETSLAQGMRLLDDDGSWKLEGPGYWHLATEHLTYLLAAYDTAGIEWPAACRSPGIGRTGRYRCYVGTPTAALFNFSDSEESRPGLWWLRWLGNKFQMDELHELAEDRTGSTGAAPEVHPMDLLWRRTTPPAGAPALGRLPTSGRFAEIAVLRGEWKDGNAAYVGIKGGETTGWRSHSHLDLGHFVYEVAGVRWAIDLEPDTYSDCYLAPPLRYGYYRANTFGHNTLVVGARNQVYPPTGDGTHVAALMSPIEELNGDKSLTIDVSAAYPGAKYVRRKFTLTRSGALIIADEFAPLAEPVEVLWSLHTKAEVTCGGGSATLDQKSVGGTSRRLRASVSGVDGVGFECTHAGPPQLLQACGAKETAPDGVQRLFIKFDAVHAATQLVVTLSPLDL